MKSDSFITTAIAVVRFVSASGNLMSELFLVQMLLVTSETDFASYWRDPACVHSGLGNGRNANYERDIVEGKGRALTDAVWQVCTPGVSALAVQSPVPSRSVREHEPDAAHVLRVRSVVVHQVAVLRSLQGRAPQRCGGRRGGILSLQFLWSSNHFNSCRRSRPLSGIENRLYLYEISLLCDCLAFCVPFAWSND